MKKGVSVGAPFFLRICIIHSSAASKHHVDVTLRQRCPVKRQATDKYPDVLRSNPRVAVERFLGEEGEFQRAPPPIPYGPGNFLDGFLQRRS